MDPAECTIVNLRSRPDWLPRVLEWQHSEWQRTFGSALGDRRLAAFEQRRKMLASHLGRSRPFPATLVAECNNLAVGAVSLTPYLLSGEAESIWLSNMFVLPSYRRRRVGSELLRAAEMEAMDNGVALLRLYTTDAAEFYIARGWEFCTVSQIGDEQVDILSKQVSRPVFS